MKKLLLIFFAVSLGTLVMAQDISVTHQCDMSVKIAAGEFDPMTDLLVIRGSFQIAAGDTADWNGDMFAMEDPDADEIYTLAVLIPQSFVGTTFEFKYAISPDGWEGVPNRSYVLDSQDMILDVVFFDDDNGALPINTLNFTADISDIIGIGAGGAFNGAEDSLLVMGLDWEGGTNVTGNRTMVVDPFNVGLYTTTLSVEQTLDSTKWKFKAYPNERFSGDGWEVTPDRWFVYQEDGAIVDLPTIVPAIFPLMEGIQNPVDVTFNVDMNNAVNRYNNTPIDPATIEFVGQRGGAEFLGNWNTGGCWCPDDTIGGAHMKVMTDAGNNIYTRTVSLPAGTNGGVYSYKFGVDYPEADTANSGTEYLDNEMPFGLNHFFNLVDGDPIEILINFGQQLPVSVEKLDDLIPAQFELEQNYPNPFNPSTKIRFTVPEAGLVSMKVYNLLGQEVAILINEEQAAGVYEVTFDAVQLPSGIYFYSINAGDFVATKKMILLK